MKNKSKAFIFVLVSSILFSVLPVIAATVKITCINSPTHVMDIGNAGFRVDIYTTALLNKEYSITYAVDGVEQTRVVTATPYANFYEDIKLTNIDKGVHTLRVLVRDAQNLIVASLDTRIGITEYYQGYPMDKFSDISMSTHMLFYQQTDRHEVELMPKIGLLKNRDEMFWSTVEYQKGVWDYSRIDEYMTTLAENHLETMIVIDYSNTKYVIRDKNGNAATEKTAPRTAEEMEAFSRYVKNTLARYPQVKTIEVWNEPNWVFWEPEPDSIDYAAMVKAVSIAAKSVRPEIEIMAGSLVYVDHQAFLTDIMEEGILPYVDSISTHPYSFPYGSDLVIEEKLKTINGMITKAGGFKEHIISEIGLPTSSNERGADERKQASEMIKIFTYSDENQIALTNWYNFRNKGNDPLDEEDNYGILNRDYTPKQALIALSNYNNSLGGAIYFGSLALTPTVRGYLYLHKGEIIMVAWSKGGDTPLSVSSRKVCDLMGNETAAVAKDTPIYLFGVPEALLLSALNQRLSEVYQRFDDLWVDSNSGQSPTAEWVDALSQMSLSTSTQEIKSIIDRHKVVGSNMIQTLYPQKPVEAMSMLHVLGEAAEMWAKLYGAFGGEQVVNHVSPVVDADKNPDASAVNRYAGRNMKKATEAVTLPNFDGKSTVVGTYSAIGDVYLSWTASLLEKEKKRDYTKVLLYPEKTDYEINRSEEQLLKVTVVNGENERFSGQVLVEDSEGNRFGSSPTMTFEAGESRAVDVTVQIPSYIKDGEKKLTLTLKDNHSIISKRGVRIHVTAPKTVYNCFNALSFENQDLLNITDRYNSVAFINGGEGSYQPNSGNSAIYVNGNGGINIQASAAQSSVMPADGDYIDGTYYLKVMEEPPSDWRQPIIQLYGIRNGEKFLLAEPKNLNTFSVWSLSKYKWHELELVSSGIPYSSDMELRCEITVGIGTSGGLKFMLDDISYFSSINEYSDGLTTALGVPQIKPYTAFNGSFEISGSAAFPNNWGMYVPNQNVDQGVDAFVPVSENPYHGNHMMQVNRGGSMWNIITNTSAMTGGVIGGSYMLFIPENANLNHNYPRVWVEYVSGNQTYTIAESPRNHAQYPVKPGWNIIPILSKGNKIPKNIERINLMVETPNIIDNEIKNKPYSLPYYIDDIKIGDIIKETYISKNASASFNGGGVDATFILTNAKDYNRVSGTVVSAVYQDNTLLSCKFQDISMRGKGSAGAQSAQFNFTHPNIPQDDDIKVKLFFWSRDHLTPISESMILELE